MKIAIIGQRYNPFQNLKSTGGTETVEKNHLKLLGEAGHNVYFITSWDSEEVNIMNVKTVKLNSRSLFGLPGQPKMAQALGARSLGIHDALKFIEPEIVIIHDNMYKHLLYVLDTAIPTYAYMHDVAGVSGLLSISYVNQYIEASRRGVVVVGVSEASNKAWADFAKKSAKDETGWKPDTFTYNHVCWMHEVIQAPSAINKAITVGRWAHQKNHKKTIKICEKLGVKLSLYYPDIKDENELKIYNESVPHSRDNLDLIHGVPHDDILKALQNSTFLITCAQESFGLTAVEANQNGIPVVLVSNKKDHPIIEACVTKQCGGLFVYSTKEEAIEHVNDYNKTLLTEERQRISNLTYDMYNRYEALQRLEDLFRVRKENSSLTQFIS